MRAAVTIGAVVVAGLVLPGAVEAQRRATPYFASISAGKAMMRTGPGRNYPASWLYVRAGLPIKVIDIYKEWRKVEDPGGTQGWMLGALLTETRTAIVVDTVLELRDTPRTGGRVQYRAAPGVVGRISKCTSGWCWFDVRGRAGYVEAIHLWGVDPGEEIE
ncbi:SH3-like domain-containing protein [Sphingomonas guangdongensis]|uniref:SH3-like domain-containing protein n=1 Tax=Sphingomonas guangdongensis TaxID=1141890 RepID=A0A285QYG6_9SPHN|nr:SH3 domain-containing protein [Sphingomonas guangdongensis]SOB86963.1 SH3-like domain-containing protein [Sphingomonas guangdongensis]